LNRNWCYLSCKNLDTEKRKLRFFSNVYTTFELQKYLTFGISKSFTLFLSKSSAHSLALLKRGDTINLLHQLKRDITNIALTKLKMKNIFSFIVPYIQCNCIRESFQSIFKNSQNSTEDDLLLQIINHINPQDTKNICLFIKKSFTKRETFKGTCTCNSLSSS
jgi:hypothetical protein